MPLSDIAHLLIALAVAVGIIIVFLAIGVSIILLVSKNPSLFAETVPDIIDRLIGRG
jgi:hypothetical protein